MRKHTFVFVSLLTSLSSAAQEVIATQGDMYSTPQANISFTIGEVVMSTGTDGTDDITQGFHQTNLNFLGIDDFAPNYSVTIYPNPSSEILNIETKEFENVSFALFDAQGKLVLKSNLIDQITPVNVGQLAPGKYALQLNNDSQLLKSFKLLKIN